MIRLLNWISDFAELLTIAAFLAGLAMIVMAMT